MDHFNCHYRYCQYELNKCGWNFFFDIFNLGDKRREQRRSFRKIAFSRIINSLVISGYILCQAKSRFFLWNHWQHCSKEKQRNRHVQVLKSISCQLLLVSITLNAWYVLGSEKSVKAGLWENHVLPMACSLIIDASVNEFKPTNSNRICGAPYETSPWFLWLQLWKTRYWKFSISKLTVNQKV